MRELGGSPPGPPARGEEKEGWPAAAGPPSHLAGGAERTNEREAVPPESRPPLAVRRLGRIAYADGLELQERLVADRQQGRIPDTLLLLEHEPVFTLGRNARKQNLLLPEEDLRARGFAVFETGRGGDVTYHGPGQIVGYPILDLSPDRCDVHRYVRDLEEVLIRTCGDFGVPAGRISGLTGVWVDGEKIAAIGVRIARWVTSHGFALNVATELGPFRLIVPCGLPDRGVTSLERRRGGAVPLPEVMTALAENTARVFSRELRG